jgi:putative hemolysin
MMMNKRWFAFTLGIGLLLASCQQPTDQPESPIGLANPASVYCMAAGYQEENRTDADGGQYGVCLFPDGSECESWAFFRGECGQDKSFCAQQGGTLEMSDSGTICIFPNGSSCPEFDYAQGQCAPSE